MHHPHSNYLNNLNIMTELKSCNKNMICFVKVIILNKIVKKSSVFSKTRIFQILYLKLKKHNIYHKLEQNN